MRKLITLLVAVLALAPLTAARAQPAPTPPVRLTRVALMSQPLGMAARAGDPNLYVAEKGGRVRALDGRIVLDLTGQVSIGIEQGLLALTFSPDGNLLYVMFTDLVGETHLVEFAFRNGRADPLTRRLVLFVDQPTHVHNGGHIAFGPDGMLWVALGDGGPTSTPPGVAGRRAQSLASLLGKVLRIDPRPSSRRPYSVPADNPYVRTPGARPEIWASGLRNPWRWSFDAANGDLWIGDVGERAWEEINYRPASSRGGENYGWDHLEGNHPLRGGAPAGTVRPVHEYVHGHGNCAVTGGYVYRGSRMPSLVGAYVFADLCAGWLSALRHDGGRLTWVGHLGPRVGYVTSFGQDSAGELYVVSLEGGVFRIDPA